MNGMLKMLRALCVALALTLTLTPGASAQRGTDLGAAAVEYLASHESQLRQATKPNERLFLLAYLAPAALAAGDVEKARAYAQELLAVGEKFKSDPVNRKPFYGHAAHVGNVVLGRIALAAGDVGQAKEHLLAAGAVSGGAWLNSFGPDMLLAKELIERGEREAAVEYFDLCAKFWEMQNGRLGRWKEVVRQGGMPDFGNNLVRLDSWRFAP